MAKQTAKILIVDDDADILAAGRLLLKQHYTEIICCQQPIEIPGLMAKHQFDAILLDMNFGPGASDGEEGLGWLKKILELEPGAVVVVITAHAGINMAVEAIKLGANDFIAKPWQNEKLLATLAASIRLSQAQAKAKNLDITNQQLSEVLSQNQENPDQTMLGDSGAMAEVHRLIKRAGPTEANVLILGENGTGKELTARAIHQASHRRDKVFLAIDLGSISETLFESELFGHQKGAFTGANSTRLGQVLAAQGGTLFLDEIGNLPLHLQSKLLTMLAQRQIRAVGSEIDIAIDIRIIAATNLDIETLKTPSRFRQDLLFRLNTIEIHMPALSERRDDIPVIANYYARHYARKYDKLEKHFSDEALKAICEYHWPGNIRALRHAVERAVILSESDVFGLEDFALSQPHSPHDALPRSMSAELNLEIIEKRTIKTALESCAYNISHAAKKLGLTRAALYRRMEKHEL